jgi:uncharacterized membrane protein
MNTNRKVLKTSIVLGLMAGVRTMSPAVLLSKAVSSFENSPLSNTPLSSPQVRKALQAMAALELIVDKLPFMPNRTNLMGLLGRLSTAGIASATLSYTYGEPPIPSAVAGASAALFSAYVTFNTRKFLTKNARVPDFLVAMGEDLTVAALAWWLLYGETNEQFVVREV